MSLWGATDSDESKPKNLTTAEKKQVFANSSGWVLEAGSSLSGNDNTSATPEVLVAIGELTTSIGAADITEIEWITTTADKSAGFSLSVRARFYEAVDVDTSGGTPYLAVTNGNQGSGSGRGPYTCVYTATGSTANRKRFILASQTIAEDDVLTLGGANIQLASGTISDTVRGGTAQAASLVLSGLTAVTHTVLA